MSDSCASYYNNVMDFKTGPDKESIEAKGGGGGGEGDLIMSSTGDKSDKEDGGVGRHSECPGVAADAYSVSVHCQKRQGHEHAAAVRQVGQHLDSGGGGSTKDNPVG